MSYGDWHGRDDYHVPANKRLLRAMISSDRLYRQVFLVLMIGIMLLALLFSRSRAGITGAGVGLLTFTLLVYYANRRLSKGFWMIIGAVLLLLFVYGNQMGFDPIIERFLVILEGNIYRTDLWRDGIAIVSDHPLGIGLGNLNQVMPVYLTSTVSEVTFFSHIHNDYLQVLIEVGWPGFLIVVFAFFIFMIRSIGRIVKLNLYDEPVRFFIGAGAVSGLVSMAFHSFFDFNLQIPANCVYFVLMIFLTYSTTRTPVISSEGHRD
jgi:O-antigen ligase